MLFNSLEFILFFLPITLLIFFTLRAKGLKEFAFMWLVLASLFFYGWWEAKYVVLIVASILVNFLIGHNISRVINPFPKKAILIVGIVLNLGLLGYYKYANFFVQNVNTLFGSSYHLETIILPLAISFFTFQQIAYLVDAYRGEVKEYNFTHYCLFVTFFPQLIAGPIVHHKEMMPQFMRNKELMPKVEDITVGIFIFVIGLFKKIVLADSFAPVADSVFNAADAGSLISMTDAWVSSIAYTFQLYFDFSGYTDMAIGVARLFGIRLPQNFNSPYRATSIIDFWRRWHMTLSRFLREYLYIALGGNRCGNIRRNTNILITMLLGGLWHGAGWNFLIWGGLHGLYLMINHAWATIVDRSLPKSLLESARFIMMRKLFGFSLTFLAVVFALVFFRATSFDGAMTMISAMLNLNWQSSQFDPLFCKDCFEMTIQLGLGLMAGFLIIIFTKNSFNYVSFSTVATTRYSIAIGLMGFVTLLFVFARMVNNAPSPFIYFQF